MLLNLAILSGLVAIQLLLTVGMKEPGRSAMRTATLATVGGFGIPLLAIILLGYLGY